MSESHEQKVPQNSNTTTVSTGEADKDLIRMADRLAAQAEHHDHPATPAK